MILHPNLVGYWQLENNAFDARGNNHLTTVGASFAAGKFGRCGAFDGADDSFEKTSIIGLPQGSSPRTACAWIYPTATAKTGQYDARGIVGWGGIGTYKETVLGMVYINGGEEFNHSWNGGQCHSNGASIPQNEWTHLAFSYAGGQASVGTKLFKNGVNIAGELSDKDTTSLITGTTGMSIGQLGPRNYCHFAGLIDAVMIFNCVLPEPEIKRCMLGLMPVGRYA